MVSRRRKDPAPSVRLVFDPRDQAAREVLNDGLDRYNTAVTGFEAYYPVAFFLKTGDGEVLGGLHGHIWGGWLSVRVFWIAAPLRRGGHGRRLLRAAEALAKERGCVGAYLDTFGFQARPFYEKEGYTVYGTREDSPVGHAHHYLAKRFDGRPVNASRTRSRTPRTARTAKRGDSRQRRSRPR